MDKQQTWKDKLEEVRGFNKPTLAGTEETTVETVDEQHELDEIEELLKKEFDEQAESQEENLESLEEKRDRLQAELNQVESELAEENQSVEKSIEKLTERNMLGRLAKSLRLNEQGKLNESLLTEMRIRELKEISKIVIKEDFYSFINAGNNVLRTLEENAPHLNGKKYLEYLVKHNIM